MKHFIIYVIGLNEHFEFSGYDLGEKEDKRIFKSNNDTKLEFPADRVVVQSQEVRNGR